MASTAPGTDDLLERASRGDTSARDQLLARYRDRLKRMVAVRLDRRLAARVEPSDVVQEALIDAAQGFTEYLKGRPLPFHAWLRQFTWDRLVKLHRTHITSKKRSVRREQPAAPALTDESVCQLADRLAGGGTSPSDRLIRDELRDRVRAAMAGLSERDSEILVMRDLEGLSIAEVAELLGITEGNVKVRRLRALQRLRAALEDPR